MIFRLLLIFLIFVSSGGILFQAYGEYLTIVIFILISFLLFISFKKFLINRKLFISLIFINLFVLLFLFFSNQYTNTNVFNYIKLFLRFFYMSLVIVYYFKIGFHKLQEDIYIVLKIILILSLINFLLINFIPNIFSYSFSGKININTIFYIFNYLSKTNLSNFNIYRNQGLYWEPGVLQYFLNLLVFISLYINKNMKIFLLSAFAIVTTFSTVGIVILAIQVFNFYLIKSQITIKNFLIYLLFFGIIGFVAYINIIEKLYGSGIHSSSLRYLDLMFGIYLIKLHPIFGIGYDFTLYKLIQNDLISNFSNMSDSITMGRGNTNSIIASAVYLGVPFGLLLVYGLYKQIIFRNNKNIIFLISFLTLISEPLIFTNYFLLLIISGYFALARRYRYV